MQPTDLTAVTDTRRPSADEDRTTVVVRPKVRWQTRQIAQDQNDRVLYVKLTIVELAVYIVFFVLFVSFCSGLYSYSTFVANQEFTSLFISSSFFTSADAMESIKFKDIITMEHFWKYFHNVLCEKLYAIPVGADKENGSQILGENELLFRPRVRQVRVEKGHCEIRNQFKGLFDECYVPYSIKYEDKASFGLHKESQWTYSNDSATQGSNYQGKIAYYGAGGYYFDFPKDKSIAKTIINDLEYNTWLNRGTRAVFLDLAIYNYNINMICAIKLVFEFPAYGGVIPSSSFRTVKLYRYVVANSIFTLVGMLVVVGFIVYYTIEELYEIAYFRQNYFTIFWNVVDFGIIILAWFSLGIVATIAYEEYDLKFDNSIIHQLESQKFVEYLVTIHEILLQLMAYLFFFICVKIVKYTDLNKSMTTVYLSVGRCFKIIAGYLMIMAIVVTAFAILGYCAFGTQVEGFSSMNDSLKSALRILTRDFDFQSLDRADRAFTAFFFVLFACIVIFIFVTMLVAIVFHAYYDVDVEELLSEQKLYVCDKVNIFVDNLMKKIWLKNWAVKRQNNRWIDELNEHITYQDVYKILKRCRFTDSDVDGILSKYNIEPQKTVNEDKARQLLRDILQQRNPESTSKKNDAKTTQESPNLEWLVKRVDLIEESLDQVHKKCDIVIARLDTIRVQLPSNYAEQTTNNTAS